MLNFGRINFTLGKFSISYSAAMSLYLYPSNFANVTLSSISAPIIDSFKFDDSFSPINL